MIGWLLKQFIRRYDVPPRPFVFRSFRGDRWFLVDHFGKIWCIRYTGAYDGPPFVIELLWREL